MSNRNHGIGKVMVLGTADLSEATLRMLDDGGSMQDMLLSYACLHSGSNAGYLLIVHDVGDVDYRSKEWRDGLRRLGVETTLLDALLEAQRDGCWYLRIDESHNQAGGAMANKNCLEGIRCPICGHEDSFRIAGETLFDVTDAGAEMVGDAEWDDANRIKCHACGHIGTVGGFRCPTRARTRGRRRRP